MLLKIQTTAVGTLFHDYVQQRVLYKPRNRQRTVKPDENADAMSQRHGGLTWNTLLTLVRTKFTCYISHLFLPLLWLKNRNNSKDVFTSHLDLHYRLYMLPHDIQYTKVLKHLRGRKTVPPEPGGFTAEWRSCGDCESCGHFFYLWLKTWLKVVFTVSCVTWSGV